MITVGSTVGDPPDDLDVSLAQVAMQEHIGCNTDSCLWRKRALDVLVDVGLWKLAQGVRR